VPVQGYTFTFFLGYELHMTVSESRVFLLRSEVTTRNGNVENNNLKMYKNAAGKN